MKYGYGEEWKRFAGLMKLVTRKCPEKKMKTGKY